MVKGLYLHIPFCKRICSYCDFNKRVSSDDIMNKYKNSLIQEILHNKERYKNIETIYIGGGTPSFYPYLEDILKVISSLVDLDNIKEFTIESTLETVLNLAPYIKKYNINRVSIGIETFNEQTMKYINRPYYNEKEIRSIVNELRKSGISNINMDLISGLPYETFNSIKHGLKIIKNLRIDHVSYYDLIVEDKTKLSHDLKFKKISIPNQDELYKNSNYINKKLKSFGFKRYEFSNYSKKGKESIHNLIYWNLDDYVGLGVGAHSLINGKRFYNTDSLIEYINNPTNSKKEEETDIEKEYIILGLRKIKGISISSFNKLFNTNIFIKYKYINDYIKKDILRIRGDYLSFTNKGINLSNLLFREIV